MPEYLAPGVYVEETSFRPKTIEGVSTSTAGFVGPARFGPTEGEPELLTSFADFERLYGGLDPLTFVDAGERTNFLAHGVRAFFEEGGRRCYVARVFNGTGGLATGSVTNDSLTLNLTARFPGEAGDMRVTFFPRLTDNVLVTDPITSTSQLRRVRTGDIVYVTSGDATPATGYYRVGLDASGDMALFDASDVETALTDLDVANDLVQPLSVDVLVERPIIRPQRPAERYEQTAFLEGFTLNPAASQSLPGYFRADPLTRALAISVPFQLDIGGDPADDTGIEYARVLFGADATTATETVVLMTGGGDGDAPTSTEYTGDVDLVTNLKSGLVALEDVEDISIVAMPGYSADFATDDANVSAAQAQLISHCERMRYRIAVLDCPPGQNVSAVRAYRSTIDSRYAALYYPWVTIFDPITGDELDLPPSGFVSGIYARNDVERGVQKAPANEVVRSAVGFEFAVNTGQQEVLNPEGVNCFRFFEGRGNRLWGARTATSDGEWKYVNLRRYFAYLERSIDVGTQVFVFESNGERLWANVRRTIEDFLFNEWKSGRTMGVTPEEAYFVRCDRTTMTQNDIDNGRLICLIGVAPLRPAEFVIFRIGQKLIESRGA